MPGWNGWYHCMANTYGTWLPGDPRGFRTCKHREHVEGDYKSPPPKGKYDERYAQAKRSLTREPVVLSLDARRVVIESMIKTWVEVHSIEVLALAVSGRHMHVLVRFGGVELKKPTPHRRGLRERDPARFYVGIAKERSSKALALAGLVKPGVIWAKRGKIVPIKDRQHQLNVYQYILDHEQEGALVWSFKAVR